MRHGNLSNLPKVTALPRKRSRIMNPGSLAPEFMLLITVQYHFPNTHTYSKEELPNNLQSNTLPLGIYSFTTNTHVHRSVSKNAYGSSVCSHKGNGSSVEDKTTYKKIAIRLNTMQLLKRRM